LAALALPEIARAQAAAPDQTSTAAQTNAAVPTPQQVNSGAAAPAESEEVTKLPPFEVQSSSKDIGYYTQNTTMGTRLNSNLGDLAASITVISKQQMTDTSSVNINDLFLYEASTEGTENYTSVGGAGKGAGYADTIQNSPQTANRVRGLGSVDVTRDYFITNPAIQLDSYNIDDAELARGPNSTLFGIGSPSGILNESIEKAVLNKDTNEISARYGSFGDFRSTLNINRSLIPDKFAIAVAGLYANAHPTAEEPSYDIQRREFAAITIKPFPTTTIRANIEYYDNPNRRAESLTPADEVTPWLANGSPKWDPITYTATVGGVTSAPITNNLLVPAGLIGTGLGNSTVGDPQFYVVHGVVQLWEQAELGSNFGSPGTPTNAVGSVNGTGTNAATNIWGPIGFEREQYSGGNYAKFSASAPAGQVTYPLFHDPGITNPKLLNYQGVNLLSGNLGEDKAQIYNVEVEQQITDNLFLEAGWYREQFNTTQHNYQGGNVGNAVMVDPNVRFLNGTPNPYFGVPFLALDQPDDIINQDLNEQERIQLVYQLDFTKNNNWTKWFGHHTMDVFYQHRENDVNSWRYRMEVLDAHSWDSTTNIGPNSNGPSGVIAQRFYLSNAGSAISYSPGAFVNTNFTYPLTWYNTQLNGGTWTNENVKLGPTIFPASTSKTQQQVWSYAGSLQDYLLDDRLIVTLGQRHDYERNRTTQTVVGDPNTGLTDLDNLSQWSNWVYADGITRQYGAVLHVTKWLSVHYNKSSNFQVSGLGEDLFGNVLPDPTGTGKDYGVSVSLFDDKLVAEMNWYESNAANSREGNTTYVNRAVRTDYGGFVPWAQEVATNNLGANASAAAINAYAQTIVQYPTGLAGLATATQFEADTQTVNAKGWEFNLIYNPLRNWTMKFTADQDQAIYSNVYPHVQAYLAARLPVWTKATDPVLGPFWTTISAGNVTGGAAIGPGSPQQWLAGTVNAAGLDVELAQQGIVSPDLSKYHFNYLTNYQFVTGKLKGFGLGTALRYETPAAIGYPGGAPDPAALGAIDTLQAFNPIYGKEVLHEDAWISYKMKLPFLDDRILMTIQLNCRDMWSNGYLLTVQVNPDSAGDTWRIVPPRQWYLQTTFDF
jgi:outer membrane receptor for ferric coprogen and ferric-rhodotorulic acid